VRCGRGSAVPSDVWAGRRQVVGCSEAGSAAGECVCGRWQNDGRRKVVVNPTRLVNRKEIGRIDKASGGNARERMASGRMANCPNGTRSRRMQFKIGTGIQRRQEAEQQEGTAMRTRQERSSMPGPIFLFPSFAR